MTWADAAGGAGAAAVNERLRSALRLYLVADAGLVSPGRLPDVVAAALSGGVTMLQLRAKSLSARAQVDLARELRRACASAGIPFVVNDRIDVALAAEADGAHVGHAGVEDLTPAEARRLLGPRAIVGVSVGSAAEAASVVADASYVSTGPIFATATKPDAGPPAGSALLRAVRASTTLPVVAIGGIRPAHVPDLVAAGADGVCVASAILEASDPAHAARALRDALASAQAMRA